MSFGVAILALAFLVLVHEAGHFVVARWVGMRPRKFYIGFGPAIVKRVRGGVEYGIGSLPLGGYVKIPGMHRPAAGDLRKSLKPQEQEGLEPRLDALDAAMEREDDDDARQALAALEPELGTHRMYEDLDGALAPDAYWRQAAWKRVVVIAAGPATNVLFAVFIFAVVFMIATFNPTSVVDEVVVGSPAAAAGLAPGDRILTVAGTPVEATEIARHINATHARPFTLVVSRGGERVAIGPLKAKLDQGAYRIGFRIGVVEGPGKSLPAASSSSVRLVWEITAETGRLVGELVTGNETENISSAVGIVRNTSDAYKRSLQEFLLMVGYISLALAILNLLPVLPLDGGHIVMAVLERLRGRAFTQQTYLRYSAVGLTLFMFLLYLGLRNDLFGGSS